MTFFFIKKIIYIYLLYTGEAVIIFFYFEQIYIITICFHVSCNDIPLEGTSTNNDVQGSYRMSF